MTEWDIQSRSDSCTVCRQVFADKQTYHTLLGISGEGYYRRDLCAGCFAGADRADVISYWQGEFRVPPPPPPEAIQKETAETLLRKLVESTDPAHAAARYILAVMLERKKILKHRDTTTDDAGNELLIYEHARTAETFTLPDPHLRLDELDKVQQEVAELLSPSDKPVESAKAEP